MSEIARTGPLDYDVNGQGNRWIRFVLPQPNTVSMRNIQRLARHAAGECGAWAVVVAVALALLAPVLGFAVAGGWALYTYAHTLATLWQNVKSYQLANLSPSLHTLDLAARVGLASAGYFALLSALIVLMAGLLGTRWHHLYLFPGVTFTLPSALAFFLGLTLSLNTLGAPHGISSLARIALLVYLLLDVILLAAALVDVSPRKRRARHARRAGAERRRTPSAPLAPVHFGPSGPLAAYRADLAEALAAMPELAPTEDKDGSGGGNTQRYVEAGKNAQASEKAAATLPSPAPVP